MNTGNAFFGYVEPRAPGSLHHAPVPAVSDSIQLDSPTSTLACFAAGPNGLMAATGEADGMGAAFLGELYNAATLRRELGAPADTPLPRLLLQAFERWSVHCLERLDGICALACWQEDTLYLYRDGSSARNLYHMTTPHGGVAFATDLDRLFELPGIERRIARRSLHEYLRLLDISAPNTLYEGVSVLEAGHVLSWSPGRQHTEPVDPQVGATAAPSCIEEAIDVLEARLQQSCESRLRDLDRPAAFLSGGVDSSLVCALAKRFTPDLTAVTVGFSGAHFDETPVARKVAQHLEIRHEVLHFDREQYLRAFETFNHGAEQPCADPAAPPTLLGFEYCQDRFGGMLESSGADENVGLMPPRHVRIAVAYAAPLPASMRRALLAAMHRLPVARRYTPILDFEHPAELMMRWDGFTRQEIEALCGEPVSFEHTQFFRIFGDFPRTAHFERYSALEDAMPNDRVHQAARMTGLPVRFPYYEAGVDAYIRALPIEYRYQPGEPKRILRELLARYVPRSIWDAPKHGFDFPFLEFLEGEDYALVRKYLDENRWRRLQVLEPTQVAAYGKRFIAGEKRLLFRIWALVVLAAWLEGHGDDQ